jgi:hypothetical protein
LAAPPSRHAPNYVREEAYSRLDPDYNIYLGYRFGMIATKDRGASLGIKDFATGLLGRGRTANRPSPPFLPFISREPTGYTAPPSYIRQLATAPVTTAPLGHDGTASKPGLSLTSPHAGDNPYPGHHGLDFKFEQPTKVPPGYAAPPSLATGLLGHEFELQKPPPKEQPAKAPPGYTVPPSYTRQLGYTRLPSSTEPPSYIRPPSSTGPPSSTSA